MKDVSLLTNTLISIMIESRYFFMKKIEFIWRHLLFEAVEKGQPSFRQQDLSVLFHISSSTVNLALVPLRSFGAVKVGGRGFEVIDAEKLLFHWANHRLMPGHVTESLRVALPVREIEQQLPAGSIPTAYTAVRERFGDPPADYNKVYCYHPYPAEVVSRFHKEIGKGPENVFVFTADPFMSRYGHRVTLGQLYVDLWNLADWYAKDFCRFVKDAIDELLS